HQDSPQNCTHHRTVTSHRTGVDFEREQTFHRTSPSTPCTPSPVRTFPSTVNPSVPERSPASYSMSSSGSLHRCRRLVVSPPPTATRCYASSVIQSLSANSLPWCRYWAERRRSQSWPP